MSDIKKALTILQAEGIDRVKVQFSGGGDSGQIDDVRYYCGDKDVLSEYVGACKSVYVDGKLKLVETPATKTLDTVRTVSVGRVYDSEKKEYVEVSQEENLTPDAVIENHVYDELSASGVDWYNNEGGQGVYEFFYDDDDNKWTYEFVIDVNYVEAVTEHSTEGAIGEEDEE